MQGFGQGLASACTKARPWTKTYRAQPVSERTESVSGHGVMRGFGMEAQPVSEWTKSASGHGLMTKINDDRKGQR